MGAYYVCSTYFLLLLVDCMCLIVSCIFIYWLYEITSNNSNNYVNANRQNKQFTPWSVVLTSRGKQLLQT